MKKGNELTYYWPVHYLLFLTFRLYFVKESFDENEGVRVSRHNSYWFYLVESLDVVVLKSHLGCLFDSKNRIVDAKNIKNSIEYWISLGVNLDEITISCLAYWEHPVWEMTARKWLELGKQMSNYENMDIFMNKIRQDPDDPF